MTAIAAKIMIIMYVAMLNAETILEVRIVHCHAKLKPVLRKINKDFHLGPTGSCPSTYPYVYYSGNYCCKTNKENFNQNHGEKCDNSEIQFDSLCCENGDFVPCMHDTCYDHGISTNKVYDFWP